MNKIDKLRKDCSFDQLPLTEEEHLVMCEKQHRSAEILMWAILLCAAIVVFSATFAHAEMDMAKIAMIESSGNPLAHNKRDDSRGLFQITPIVLKEWNQFHKQKHTMNDLWNPLVNEKIARWYMNIRIPAMLKAYKKPVNDHNMIVAWNAGISYVVKGKKLPPVTVAYLRKYGAA